MPGQSKNGITTPLETPLALRKAICQRAEERRQVEHRALFGKVTTTPRTKARREEAHRSFESVLAEDRLAQRRARGPLLRFPSVQARGELRGHGPPRDNHLNPEVIVMGKRHGKEVPVTVLPRRAPPQALAKPPVLPARQTRPKPRVAERRERHPPGARLSSRNATYQGEDDESDSEPEDKDEGGDEEHEEEDDEGDGYAEALKSFEFSESVSASESDDNSDNNEEPRSGNPNEEDKLALLREFVFQGNDWYKGLRRGHPQNRDMRFWEKVLRSLGKPRPFPTWAQAAATFRRVIGPRRAKANNGTRAKKPLAGPEGEKDRLIDKCVQICSQRDILEDFVGRGYIKQKCIREIVRDGSLECILKGLLADHFGGAHAGEDRNRRNERAEDRAAEHGDETDGDRSTSESGESDAANNSSEWEEPRDGYHTPASSPPPVRSVRVQHRSKKRGREEDETVSEEEPLSKRIAAGFAKIIQESEEADLAMRRKRETEIMEKVEAMMAGLGKGKAREM